MLLKGFLLAGLLVACGRSQQVQTQFQQQSQGFGAFPSAPLFPNPGHVAVLPAGPSVVPAAGPAIVPVGDVSILPLPGSPVAVPSFPAFSSFDSLVSGTQGQRVTQSGSNAAAAGTAGAAGPGSANSLNQANQVATRDTVASSGISANTAQGFTPTASGAAQAGGQLSSAEQINNQVFRQTGLTQGFPVVITPIGRRRRSLVYLGYPYGGNSQASASGIGGGNAIYGRLRTDNVAFTNTNGLGATGFASGSTSGAGYGINEFNAVQSNSQSNGGLYGPTHVIG